MKLADAKLQSLYSRYSQLPWTSAGLCSTPATGWPPCSPPPPEKQHVRLQTITPPSSPHCFVVGVLLHGSKWLQVVLGATWVALVGGSRWYWCGSCGCVISEVHDGFCFSSFHILIVSKDPKLRL